MGSGEGAGTAEPALEGRWRFELASPGGPLPFFVELEGGGGALVDAHERLPFSSVEVDGSRVRLEIAHYDSVLEGHLEGGMLRGEWRRRSPGKGQYTVMPFEARPATGQARFQAAEGTRGVLDGDWNLRFTEEDGGSFEGQARLRSVDAGGTPGVEGTILTDTGDYRFLEGARIGDELHLSVFDGAHAFLFTAHIEGEALVDGHFWSRDSYHATFEGTPPPADASALADPMSIVELRSEDGRFHFDFPQLGGGRLDEADPRFDGKVVLIEVFGTWCPNCNDQAPLMSEWHRTYGPRGLEVVGIAFEFTGDRDDDMEMLARYAERYEVDYPLLLGGSNDKAEASKALPDLSRVAAYPTTIFVGRDGTVRSIYSGFSGPATGPAYERLQAQFESTIETLLAE